MVRRVKRKTHNEPIDNPYIIDAGATVSDLRVEMQIVNVSAQPLICISMNV